MVIVFITIRLHRLTSCCPREVFELTQETIDPAASVVLFPTWFYRDTFLHSRFRKTLALSRWSIKKKNVNSTKRVSIVFCRNNSDLKNLYPERRIFRFRVFGEYRSERRSISRPHKIDFFRIWSTCLRAGEAMQKAWHSFRRLLRK